ncbi:MAG: GAF domain-containing protein, partial [Acidobacteria bacterium]|nr:GAF domain-containing protein [Acidobacteriota bacterium]
MDPIEVRTKVELDPGAPGTLTALSPEVIATMIEIGEEINASLDLDDVLRATAALIKRIVPYEIFAVMLLDEAASELYFRFAVGYPKEIVENWRIPLGKGVTGRTAQARKAIRVSDVTQEAEYIPTHETVRSELAVPLLLKGKCIGVLDFQSNRLNYFSRDQQDILVLLTSRIATAIENARLYERSLDQANTLQLLNEVSREASAILDVDELLHRAAELVKRIINYQIFGIFLYDERRQVFRQQFSIKYGRTIQEKFEVRNGEGVVGAAVAAGKPLIVPDVSKDPRYIVCNPESRSELIVPMIHKGKVLGALDLESPQLNYFNEEHVQALSTLAAQLAISIANARLYEQVARDEARMERELRAARRIQGAMLPTVPQEDYGLDIAARYLPARELGGDLYDFLRYGPQQLAIGLGDVSGKGTAAALYGAVASGILRSLSPLKLQPAEMLKRLNTFMGEQKVEDRFMTLCFVTWQRGRMRLRVGSAGHSQPLLLKGGVVTKIKITGYPLGIFDEVDYEEWSDVLSAGDILVL